MGLVNMASGDVSDGLRTTFDVVCLLLETRWLMGTNPDGAGRLVFYENRRFMAWPAMTAWPCMGGGMP
jgi:hypothetical protein